MIYVKLKCNCGHKEYNTDRHTKKVLWNDLSVLKCKDCDGFFDILSIQNDRELKLDSILSKIKED